MAAYGGYQSAEEQQRDFGVAADLAHTCHEMYRRSGTGLGPAAVYFTPSAVAKQDYVVQVRPRARVLVYLFVQTCVCVWWRTSCSQNRPVVVRLSVAAG